MNDKQVSDIGESRKKETELETKSNNYQHQIEQLNFDVKKLGQLLNQKVR